jgi:hypothetical protein
MEEVPKPSPAVRVTTAAELTAGSRARIASGRMLFVFIFVFSFWGDSS